MKPDPETLRQQFEPKLLKELSTTQQLFGARFTPCGKFLISGGFDGAIHRWNATAEEFSALTSIPGLNAWVEAIAFGAENELVYCGDSWGKLGCWSYAEENPKPKWIVEAAHDGWVRGVSVSPDGKQIVTCGRDQLVKFWEAESGKQLLSADAHREDVLSVAYHPTDGVVSGDLLGKIKQWDTTTGKVTREFDASALHTTSRLQEVGGVRVLRFNPAGTMLFAAGTKVKNGGNVQGVPTVLCFDWRTGKLLHTLSVGAASDVYVTDLQFHPAGFLMITTSGNPGTGKLHFLDDQLSDDAKPFFSSTKMANCKSISLHPEGVRLAVTATNRGSNGNGRRLNKDGEYEGNSSPVHLMEFPAMMEPAAE